MLPLNESALSKKQGEILKFHETFMKHMDKGYLDYYNELK